MEPLTGLIVIDEVQRAPELFPLLRVLIDRHRARQRYLILGSASRDLIRQSLETLAGRIAYLELSPFTAFEAGDVFRLWLRWPRIGKPGASRITWRRWWPAPWTRKSPARWTLSEEAKGGGDSGEPLYDEAVAFVVESRRASISAVQRKFRIGYNRAARLIKAMEEAGVVSAMNSQRGPELNLLPLARCGTRIVIVTSLARGLRRSTFRIRQQESERGHGLGVETLLGQPAQKRAFFFPSRAPALLASRPPALLASFADQPFFPFPKCFASIVGVSIMFARRHPVAEAGAQPALVRWL